MFTRSDVVRAAITVVVMAFSMIGRSQDAPDGLIRKAYDVSSLMASGTDETDLVELVTSVIRPEEWDRVGGRGTVSVVEKNQLQVLQKPAAHAELARLLNALGKMPALNQDDPTAKKQSGKRIVATDGKLEPNAIGLIVYDVTDLVPTGDYDALVSPIVDIEPPTWEDTGGPGVIVAVPAAKALVIVQTLEMHRKVQDWLRRQRRQAGMASQHQDRRTRGWTRVAGS